MKALFTANISQTLPEFLAKGNYKKIALLVDENTREHCLPLIMSTLPQAVIIEIKSGEQNKVLDTCTRIWEEMTDAALDRNSLLVNLGGGVIGDMGGFCASTYKRGIDFINIPTTLLSQVDASIGGKLGIDFNGLKNHIGLFREPKVVIIYPEFLKTLSKRELRSGYAEILKHAIIADGGHWEQIKKGSLRNINPSLIEDSVRIKTNVVLQDPEEAGLRKILNFGHTIGHALESHFLNTSAHLLHGEAVALGMICEAHVAFQKKILDQQQLDEISQVIFNLYGKVSISPQDLDPAIAIMYQDKKNKDNKILMALPTEIGKATYDVEVSPTEVKESMMYYRNY